MNDSYVKLEATAVIEACDKIIRRVDQIRENDWQQAIILFRARKHHVFRWRRKWTDEQIKRYLKRDGCRADVVFWQQRDRAKQLGRVAAAAISNDGDGYVWLSGEDANLLHWVR